MSFGVLDIGSNSAQLQIMEVCPGAPPLAVHTVKKPTLLADAIGPDGSIAEGGIRRVLVAVSGAAESARRHDVDELIVFATSAIRDATNREEILDRVQRDTGLRPQFIAGRDEAVLTYQAVRAWYGWSAGRMLVLDIGGGSLEIAWGRGGEPECAWSLPLGAGRLTRAFLADDPPTKAQLTAMRQHIRTHLRNVASRLRGHAVDRPVATSKTFKQLARLTGSPPARAGLFARRTVRGADLAQWVPRLATMPQATRAALRGITARRAGQIVAGAVAALVAMEELDIASLEVCPWALREGIALRHQAGVREHQLPLRPVDPVGR